MALIDRIAERQLERSADPVSMEEFGHLLGGVAGGKTKSGVMMSSDRALGIPGWYSGCRYLSEAISFLPVHTLRDTSDGRTRRADPPWLRRPDVDTVWEALVEHWIMSMIHRGNGFAFKSRNDVGQVVGLRGIHPNRVTYGSANGRKLFHLDGRTDITFTTREILHIPGMSMDGMWGVDPIRYMADTLGIAAAADEYAGSWYAGGDKIKQYVSLPNVMTQEQAAAAVDVLNRFHRGLSNAHELGVLTGGGELKAVQLDPTQVQLLESRKFTVTEMSRLLRIPPHKLYDLERSTFSNIEHQNIDAVMDSVRPWVERIETWVNADPDLLVEGNKIEFQLEGLLRGDSRARAEFYKTLINAGVMAPQAAARLEDLPAPDELNYYLRPLNMAVIKPGQPDPDDDDVRKLSVAEAVQKVYPGVGKVISATEARQIINDAGGNLTGPGPKEANE